MVPSESWRCAESRKLLGFGKGLRFRFLISGVMPLSLSLRQGDQVGFRACHAPHSGVLPSIERTGVTLAVGEFLFDAAIDLVIREEAAST